MAADTTVGVRLEADATGAIKNVKNFKAELVAAQKEVVELSAKFGATSKEAAAAAQKAAGLKDAIGDAKSLVDAFNPDTKFRAFGASISTVVGGFTALQGVMGLLGVESEETQKMLLKVQSALAISQGFAQLQEGVQTFKNLGAVIKSATIFQKANAAATAIAGTVMRAFGASAVATGTGFKILRAAIISTGIGALIVGLGLLINKIIEWTESTDSAEKAQKRLNDALEKSNNLIEKNLTKIAFNTQKRLLEAKIAGEGEAEQRAITLEGLKDEADQLDTQLVKKKQYALDIRKLGKATAEEVKTADDDTEKARQAHEKKLSDIELFGIQGRLDIITKFREKQKAANDQDEKDRLAREAKLKAEAIAEDARLLAIRMRDIGRIKIGEIPKTAEQIQIENTVAASILATKTKEDLFLQESDARSKAYTDQKDQIKSLEESEIQAYNTRMVLLDATKNLISGLSDLLGKETAAAKILGIATATINTYIGATEVLRAPTTIPEPYGTIAKFANFTAVILTGLSAVKKIVSTQVPGGGGGGAAVSAPLQPQKPQTGSTTLDQQSINALGSAVTRSYVLESDVSSNIEKVKRLNRQARIA